ncbi:hypothetical protein A9Q73_01390 [Bermanella sp. 47_1433_sub80_T6]|nr:hypothetical protein A9Q73_01390 [Bermanella sp. 47_1433_sub80_T6]
MQTINPMVITIVQQIMINENDTDAWRRTLIQNHIFEAQEVKDLSEREISLIHHAMLVQRFSRMSSDELLEQTAKYNLQYHINFEADEFQMGAVCY